MRACEPEARDCWVERHRAVRVFLHKEPHFGLYHKQKAGVGGQREDINYNTRRPVTPGFVQDNASQHIANVA